MTDQVSISIVGSLASTVVAALAAWASVRNGQKSEARDVKAVASAAQIHLLVNNNYEAMRRQNEALMAKQASLEQQVERLVTAAAVADKSASAAAIAAVELAAAVAAAGRATPPPEK